MRQLISIVILKILHIDFGIFVEEEEAPIEYSYSSFGIFFGRYC